MKIEILNLGQHLLSGRVRKHGDLRRLAERLGIGERSLSHYYRGTRKPTTYYREILRRVLRIPILAWDQSIGDE